MTTNKRQQTNLPTVFDGATFEEIKTNLIDYFSSQDEFLDYDFMASRLNILMDQLAYSILYMQQFSNSTLYESFIRTANLRSSIVQAAQDMGYYPNGKSASVTNVIMTYTHDLNPLSSRIPRGTKFLANTEGTSSDPNQFVVINDVDARRGPDGLYVAPLSLVQGRIARTELRYNKESILIKDENIDRNYIKVFVDQKEWTNWTNKGIVGIQGTSSVFYTRETIDGHTEIYFGEGEASYTATEGVLESNYIGGLKPINQSRIVIEYISTKGESANYSTGFTYADVLQYIEVDEILENYDANPDYVGSIGGGDQESKERIREMGPIKRETQRRCVTSSDYESFISERFGSIVQAIHCFTIQNKPGYAFIAIKPKSGLTLSTVQKEDIQNYLKDFNLAPITPSVMSPQYLFIRHNIKIDYAVNKLNESEQWLENKIVKSIDEYYENEVELFNRSFHKSRMLTYIDSSDQSILGSSAEIEMVRELHNFFQTPMSGIKFNNQVKDQGIRSSQIEFIRENKETYKVSIKSTASIDGIGSIVIGPFIDQDTSGEVYLEDDFDRTADGLNAVYYRIGDINYTLDIINWSFGSLDIPSDRFNVSDIELIATPVQDNIYTREGSLIVFENDLRPDYLKISLEAVYQ